MTIKVLWPGRTKNPALRELEAVYLSRIKELIPCRLVESAAARGFDERLGEKILEWEARGLEKHLKDDYIVCLSDEGREMNSREFARFFETRASASARTVTFVVGGFKGLARRLVAKADLRLSLSRLTLSHELCRVVLLEQIYRAISTMKGRPYAK